jgi:hypothetical protein
MLLTCRHCELWLNSKVVTVEGGSITIMANTTAFHMLQTTLHFTTT